MKTVPINNGYFNYKSVDRKQFKSRIEKSLCTGVGSNCDTLIFEEETYIVGQGEFNIDRDKTQDEKFTKILVLNMLAKFMDERQERETFKVYLSTPPKMYKNQSKNLPKYLEGDYKICHNGRKLDITISSVKVYPETFIVYLNHQEKYRDKNLLIWDIGGFTTNIVLIRQGSFTINDFLTLENGMYFLDEKIAQYLSANDNIKQTFNIDDIQYMRDTEDEILKVNQPYIDELYTKHIKEIIKRIELKGWNYQLYDNLCTGGGSKILFDNIKQLVNKVELSNDPVFDNLKALELLATEELK